MGLSARGWVTKVALQFGRGRGWANRKLSNLISILIHFEIDVMLQAQAGFRGGGVVKKTNKTKYLVYFYYYSILHQWSCHSPQAFTVFHNYFFEYWLEISWSLIKYFSTGTMICYTQQCYHFVSGLRQSEGRVIQMRQETNDGGWGGWLWNKITLF